MWGHSFRILLPDFKGRLSLSSLQGENRSFSHTCLQVESVGGRGQADLKWRLLVKGRSGTESAASPNLTVNEPLLCGRTGGGRWVSTSLLSTLGK